MQSDSRAGSTGRDAALALAAAIESRASTDILDLVITAAVVVLGEHGLAAHAEDVERIVRDGWLPLTCLLIERRGRDIAMVAHHGRARSRDGALSRVDAAMTSPAAAFGPSR